MSHPPAHTLASHLIQQIRASLALLEQLDVVPAQDADTIRSTLPPPHGPFPSLQLQPHSQSQAPQPAQSPLASASASTNSSLHRANTSISGGFGRMNIGPAAPGPLDHSQQHQVVAPAPPSLPSRGPPVESRAKALWDYTGNEADDLRFRAGDVIVIDEEVNDQWYRGRVIPQGEQYPREHRGLFPSNYVEKIASSPTYYKAAPPPQQMMPYQPPPPPVYYGNNDQKQGGGYQMHPQQQQQQQQQAPQAVVVQQPEQHGHNRFGKLGSSMAQGAAGGFGFGAGAAIAGDLVNKIF